MLHIAQALAAQGRNGDTELVHMTKSEVAGLRSLARSHGTDLTVNPTTGMPEAFSLGSLFQSALPIAASFIPGVGPWGAAALQAAIGTAQTGSLEQGLQAGLSSFATNGLTEAAAAMAPSANLAIDGGAAMADGAASGAMGGIGDLGSNAAQKFNGLSAFTPNAAYNVASNAPVMAPDFSVQAQRAAMAPTDAGIGGLTGAAPAQGGLAMGQGEPIPEMQVPDAPMAEAQPNVIDRGIGWIKENPWKAGALGLAGAAGLGMFDDEVEFDKENYGPVYDYEYGSTELTPEQIAYNQANPSGEQFYLNPNPELKKTGRIIGYANGGGIASLKKPSYVGGASDGMADQVQATIDGQEPVRLSSGEFVVPADVVSHLGNGNSKAGVKKLMQMNAGVRNARTGSKKQAKAINPDKYLP